MAEGQDFDTAAFADQLSAMTDEELFVLMQKLEDKSGDIPSEDRDSSEVFVRIAMGAEVSPKKFYCPSGTRAIVLSRSTGPATATATAWTALNSARLVNRSGLRTSWRV